MQLQRMKYLSRFQIIFVIFFLCMVALAFQKYNGNQKDVIFHEEKKVQFQEEQEELPGVFPGLINLRKNSASFSLIGVDLEQMTFEQLLLTLHSYPDNTNILCHRKLRLGRLGDGGWEVCDDPEVRPRPPCVIYSFGINNEFSFDDNAARIYGCHVYSFDPSMAQKSHNRSERVHFYKVGLSGSTGVRKNKWQMYTQKDLRAFLGHENTRIDIIKMDIERSEWPSIPNMLDTNQLENVKQFLVEIHVGFRSRNELLNVVTTLKRIEEAGFMKFYVHKNIHCKSNVKQFPVIRTSCYELHYMRKV